MKRYLLLLPITGMLIFFQGCSEVQFSMDPKSTALKQDTIFDPDAPNPSVGPGITIPTDRHCSDSKTSSMKSNVHLAQKLSLRIKESKTKRIVCSNDDTAGIKSSLKNRMASLGNCSLVDGDYDLELIDEKGNDLVVGDEKFKVQAATIKDKTPDVLVDSNPENSSVRSYGGWECDENASPLYVDFRKDTSDYDILSSPSNGVLFDILGLNGGFKKLQISWFEKAKFAFLALPNSRGEVAGVDQLFGNNTQGPDGKFADNGFLALAKHDSNVDGVIDEKDVVYRDLRLWFDKNRNGKSERGELIALEKKHLISIDLKYDSEFYERDQYGNEIKFKSVVTTKSGKLKPIFDVWFKL